MKKKVVYLCSFAFILMMLSSAQESATLLLLGMGLVGLAEFGRSEIFKK